TGHPTFMPCHRLMVRSGLKARRDRSTRIALIWLTLVARASVSRPLTRVMELAKMMQSTTPSKALCSVTRSIRRRSRSHRRPCRVSGRHRQHRQHLLATKGRLHCGRQQAGGSFSTVGSEAAASPASVSAASASCLFGRRFLNHHHNDRHWGRRPGLRIRRFRACIHLFRLARFCGSSASFDGCFFLGLPPRAAAAEEAAQPFCRHSKPGGVVLAAIGRCVLRQLHAVREVLKVPARHVFVRAEHCRGVGVVEQLHADHGEYEYDDEEDEGQVAHCAHSRVDDQQQLPHRLPGLRQAEHSELSGESGARSSDAGGDDEQLEEGVRDIREQPVLKAKPAAVVHAAELAAGAVAVHQLHARRCTAAAASAAASAADGSATEASATAPTSTVDADVFTVDQPVASPDAPVATSPAGAVDAAAAPANFRLLPLATPTAPSPPPLLDDSDGVAAASVATSSLAASLASALTPPLGWSPLGLPLEEFDFLLDFFGRRLIFFSRSGSKLQGVGSSAGLCSKNCLLVKSNCLLRLLELSIGEIQLSAPVGVGPFRLRQPALKQSDCKTGAGPSAHLSHDQCLLLVAHRDHGQHQIDEVERSEEDYHDEEQDAPGTTGPNHLAGRGEGGVFKDYFSLRAKDGANVLHAVQTTSEEGIAHQANNSRRRHCTPSKQLTKKILHAVQATREEDIARCANNSFSQKSNVINWNSERRDQPKLSKLAGEISVQLSALAGAGQVAAEPVAAVIVNQPVGLILDPRAVVSVGGVRARIVGAGIVAGPVHRPDALVPEGAHSQEHAVREYSEHDEVVEELVGGHHDEQPSDRVPRLQAVEGRVCRESVDVLLAQPGVDHDERLQIFGTELRRLALSDQLVQSEQALLHSPRPARVKQAAREFANSPAAARAGAELLKRTMKAGVEWAGPVSRGCLIRDYQPRHSAAGPASPPPALRPSSINSLLSPLGSGWSAHPALQSAVDLLNRPRQQLVGKLAEPFGQRAALGQVRVAHRPLFGLAGRLLLEANFALHQAAFAGVSQALSGSTALGGLAPEQTLHAALVEGAEVDSGGGGDSGCAELAGEAGGPRADAGPAGLAGGRCRRLIIPSGSGRSFGSHGRLVSRGVLNIGNWAEPNGTSARWDRAETGSSSQSHETPSSDRPRRGVWTISTACRLPPPQGFADMFTDDDAEMQARIRQALRSQLVSTYGSDFLSPEDCREKAAELRSQQTTTRGAQRQPDGSVMRTDYRNFGDRPRELVNSKTRFGARDSQVPRYQSGVLPKEAVSAAYLSGPGAAGDAATTYKEEISGPGGARVASGGQQQQREPQPRRWKQAQWEGPSSFGGVQSSPLGQQAKAAHLATKIVDLGFQPRLPESLLRSPEPRKPPLDRLNSCGSLPPIAAHPPALPLLRLCRALEPLRRRRLQRSVVVILSAPAGPELRLAAAHRLALQSPKLTDLRAAAAVLLAADVGAVGEVRRCWPVPMVQAAIAARLLNRGKGFWRTIRTDGGGCCGCGGVGSVRSNALEEFHRRVATAAAGDSTLSTVAAASSSMMRSRSSRASRSRQRRSASRRSDMAARAGAGRRLTGSRPRRRQASRLRGLVSTNGRPSNSLLSKLIRSTRGRGAESAAVDMIFCCGCCSGVWAVAALGCPGLWLLWGVRGCGCSGVSGLWLLWGVRGCGCSGVSGAVAALGCPGLWLLWGVRAVAVAALGCPVLWLLWAVAALGCAVVLWLLWWCLGAAAAALGCPVLWLLLWVSGAVAAALGCPVLWLLLWGVRCCGCCSGVSGAVAAALGCPVLWLLLWVSGAVAAAPALLAIYLLLFVPQLLYCIAWLNKRKDCKQDRKLQC
uniref:AMP_N domain-containing protein n=1 Tax=Macrostomum lignano TaxID=282301 RepID=A0A1I8I0Q7_9PLAT